MNTTTLVAHNISEDLMKLAGYQVREDFDQHGYFTWVKVENGVVTEGCDSSFESAAEAWDEVRLIMAEQMEGEGLEADDWNILTAEERHVSIRNIFH